MWHIHHIARHLWRESASSRHKWRAIWMVALLLLTGCGLSEYERAMDEQRTRVREFDERAKLLDDPIEIPPLVKAKSKEETPAWPFDFILRLPKGYSTLPKDKANYFLDFPCFRYTGGAEGAKSIFVAAALVGVSKGQEEGKYTSEVFRQYVRFALAEYHYKINRVRLSDTGTGKYQVFRYRQFSAYPSSAPILAFDWTDYRDMQSSQASEHSIFDVYIHQDAGKQIAIAVHRPLRPANLDAIHAAIQASLSTLDLNGDIAKRRAEFKKKR